MPGSRWHRAGFDLDQRSPQIEPGRQRRQQKDCAEHVDEKHEGQQHTHISLELQRSKGPGTYADGHGQRRKHRRRAPLAHGLVERRAQVLAVSHFMGNPLVQIDPVIDPDPHAQRHHRQGCDFQADAQGRHQGVAQDRDNGQRYQNAQHCAQ